MRSRSCEKLAVACLACGTSMCSLLVVWCCTKVTLRSFVLVKVRRLWRPCQATSMQLTVKGVHVVTVNDYLAQRDAGWMGEVHHFLGLSVGVIVNDASFIYDPKFDNEDHTTTHACEASVPSRVKKPTRLILPMAQTTSLGSTIFATTWLTTLSCFASVSSTSLSWTRSTRFLIDEARTPLIISAPAG